jgi:hypothetical protein
MLANQKCSMLSALMGRVYSSSACIESNSHTSRDSYALFSAGRVCSS